MRKSFRELFSHSQEDDNDVRGVVRVCISRLDVSLVINVHPVFVNLHVTKYLDIKEPEVTGERRKSYRAL
jgi:hypothetical protein